MKEYIAKENLIKDIRKRAFHGTTIEIIKEQPTVTEAEIIQEFADKLIDYFITHAHEVSNHVSARDFICDKIIELAEKEQGE